MDRTQPAMQKKKNSSPFLLAPFQQAMLLETLNAPKGSGCYVAQLILHLDQNIDIDYFTDAWVKTIGIFSNLGLKFVWKKGAPPFQQITTLDEINIEIHDWSNLSREETNEYIETYLQADRRLGFALSKPPAFRIATFKTAPESTICIWSFHSILADQTTQAAIVRTLFSFYQNPDMIPDGPASFQDHIRELHRNKNNIEAVSFWKAYLKGYTDPLHLSFALNQKPIAANKRKSRSLAMTTGIQMLNISLDIAGRLTGFCKAHGMDMKFLFLGAWAVVLSHHTGDDDIIIGNLRPIDRQKRLCSGGMGTNLIPARITIHPEESLSKFLARIRKDWIRTQAFEHCSTVDIHSWSQVPFETPLFDVLFSYSEQELNTTLGKDKAKVKCSEIERREWIPGSLYLAVQGVDQLSVSLKYDRRQFRPKDISQILDHFTQVLTAAAQNRDQNLKDIPILAPQERQTIAKQLNAMGTPIQPEGFIHNLVDIQAASNKHRIALCAGDDQVSYREMNHAANHLANLLTKNNIQPEKRVLVILDQHIRLMVAILAILKSGGVCIPVDSQAPAEWLGWIIDDAAPDIILIQDRYLAKLPRTSACIMNLDKIETSQAPKDISRPLTDLLPENTACILYTADDSEHPKGIMLSHGSLVAYIRAASDIFEIQPSDRVLQQAIIGTDTAMEEFFTTLFSGATLVIKPRQKSLDPGDFISFVSQHKLSICYLSAPFWHWAANKIDSFPERVRTIIIKGAEIDPVTLEKWHAQSHWKPRLIRTYGPQEIPFAATWSDLVPAQGTSKGEVAMGNPLPDIQLYLLNHFSQPALPGTKGELYIGGIQTAKGYFNRKLQTQQSFVLLEKQENSPPLFKTKDLVTMDMEGKLFFKGRRDRQVQLNELTLDLDGIGKTIQTYPCITEAEVILSTMDDHAVTMTGFLVVDQNKKNSFNILSFKKWLSSKLADYMIPENFKLRDQLPLTSSGKTDYSALNMDTTFPPKRPPAVPSRAFQDQSSPCVAAPIILVGNSVGAAQAYKKQNLQGHPFYHAPIFTHFFSVAPLENSNLDIYQLAQKCIQDIIGEHPCESYIIIGECQNSIVAHEVALQLEQMDKTIELLIIIDENWKAITKEGIPHTHQRLSFWKKQWKDFRHHGKGVIFKKIKKRLKNKLFNYYTALDPIREKVCILLEKPVPESIQFRTMQSVYYKACEENLYTPTPYGGSVLLLYSNDWFSQHKPQLNQYYSDARQITYPINHSDWFKPEQVTRIIQEIDRDA